MPEPTTPAQPVSPPFNPNDYRVDRCDGCGRLDAVKRRARRRHCPSCRLYAESERASAKARQLADLADRAYLTQRMLVHAIEDARIAENNAAIEARNAGVCEDAAAWYANLSQQATIVHPRQCEDLRAPNFRLRANYRARTATAQAYAAMLSIGAGATPARYNRTLLRRAFGSCDFRRIGGKLSGAGGYPSRSPSTTVRYDGGGARCV